MQRFKLLHDESGHDYIVPVEQEELFYQWVDASENDFEDYTGKNFEDLRVGSSGWTFTDPQGF